MMIKNLILESIFSYQYKYLFLIKELIKENCRLVHVFCMEQGQTVIK